MIRFNNDYNRTAHPRVWEVLQQAAQESHPGYGTDDWCARAESIIRENTAPSMDLIMVVYLRERQRVRVN